MYRITTFLTTTLALFGFITIANAQFPESFETAVPPTGWASFRGTNDLGTNYDWTTSTIANSGSQAAYVRYENVTGGLAEDWLVTPQFTPGASSNLLTFMQRQSYTSNYGSVYTVRVSTASQTTHADFTIINTQTEADFTTVYSMKEIDLSSYEGTPIYVAFVMENDDGDNWLIDDVELSEPACSDVSVTDTQVACESFTWSDGNTYTPNNYNTCTSISAQTPGLFTNGPNATWTNVYTACVLGDGNNGAPQTLEINVCSLPAGGANYRVIKTVANGNFFNGPAQPLVLGLNTINVAGVTFDRTVKFQFSDGAVEFDALSLNGNSVYSGAPQQLLTTSTGCDSLVTLDLTFISSSSATDVISACDSYTWIDGTQYTASNNTATFVIPNAAGCDSTITLDLTILSSSTSEDIQTACDTFTWIDGNTYTESNNTATFTVPNAAGCDSTITLNLTVNTVNSGVTVVDDLTLQSDETTTGAEYQWLDCADNFAPIAGETSSTFTTQISGEYAVQVTLNGCTEISDCFIITNTLGFDELGNGFNVDLFPNPTLGSVTFNIQGVKQLDMELYDLQGKLLMHQNGIWDQDQISLEALVPGSYIIKLRSEYGNREIRIVKQ